LKKVTTKGRSELSDWPQRGESADKYGVRKRLLTGLMAFVVVGAESRPFVQVSAGSTLHYASVVRRPRE